MKNLRPGVRPKMVAQIRDAGAGLAGSSQKLLADFVFAFPKLQIHLNLLPIIKSARMELMKPLMTTLKQAHSVAVEITGYLQPAVEVPKEALLPSEEATVQFVAGGKIDSPVFRFALYGSFCFATSGNSFPLFMRFFMAVRISPNG